MISLSSLVLSPISVLYLTGGTQKQKHMQYATFLVLILDLTICEKSNTRKSQFDFVILLQRYSVWVFLLAYALLNAFFLTDTFLKITHTHTIVQSIPVSFFYSFRLKGHYIVRMLKEKYF